MKNGQLRRPGPLFSLENGHPAYRIRIADGFSAQPNLGFKRARDSWGFFGLQTVLYRRSIEKLNAHYAKLQNQIDQIYLDKLDGEVEEAFYRRNVSQWREEQAQIRARIERHEKADQDYIEQGIRLLEIARNAQEFYRTRGQAERTALLGFILPGSTLDRDRVVPVFKPPFDIINRIAQEARRTTEDTKKQAASLEATCPILLPLLDELRTFCYEHKIEEIPVSIAV